MLDMDVKIDIMKLFKNNPTIKDQSKMDNYGTDTYYKVSLGSVSILPLLHQNC